ncbi:ribonuclease P 40kDa subunit-domain-containing protein [Halteromyces radiatus]|uniref:ribonuclease P 40kDa subunit-domain-containing protein n=1 Tax=Halteromyces radiatus TaxID=101107 RepID=UPI00221EB33E|nr:ribonuclease P 40kDa subunit-domain-containing protein [Halteromyces radiatus]KAI8085193.1 ribonuclease P 40kDa subunit-domain-containing protein [Halteromyces radiatus]
MSQKLYLPDSEKQPSYCDLSYFDYEQHQTTWKKTINCHPFNHKLSIFVPSCSLHTIQQQLHLPPSIYYQVRLPLRALLDPEFFSRYIKSSNERLLFHTVGTKLDSDTVIVLDFNGHLIMNMDKFTYETFGIVGRQQKEMDRKRFRYVVDIDLRHGKSPRKSKILDRLKWCFENTMTQEYDMVMTLVDEVTGDTKTIEQWPEGVIVKEHRMEMKLEEINQINIPQWTSLERTLDGKMDQQWQEDALGAMEWIGLVSMKANRSQTANSIVNPFISTYQAPQPVEKSGFGTVITWTGFIAPSFILNALTNLRKLMITRVVPKWVSFTVWGYRDSPFTWDNRQHYYNLNGENDYTFLLFPPHASQQTFISYKMYGSHHSHS